MADKVKLAGVIEPLGLDLNGDPIFNTHITVNGRQMTWDSVEFKRKVLSKFVGDVQITLEEQPLLPTVNNETSSRIAILAKVGAVMGTVATAGGIIGGRILGSNVQRVMDSQSLASIARLTNYATILWQLGLIVALISILVIVLRKSTTYK